MTERATSYASQLRQELAFHNRAWARGQAHVESYGSDPVIVYAPENGRHGNFFDPAYAAIQANSQWERRLRKVHAQAKRALPKSERRWCELDSSTSSDALLMNVFCAPGVADSSVVRNALGVDADAELEFGWKARVPLANGRFDRTEVDLKFDSLLIEAKLTESHFQTRAANVVEAYRDLDEVFDRELLPRVELAPRHRGPATLLADLRERAGVAGEEVVDRFFGGRRDVAERVHADLQALGSETGAAAALAIEIDERTKARRLPADDRDHQRKSERTRARERFGRSADAAPNRQLRLQRARIDGLARERGPKLSRPPNVLVVANREQEAELLFEEVVVVLEAEPEERIRFHERAASGHDFRPALREEIERGELLKHAHGIGRAQHRDGTRQPNAFRARGGGAQDDGGRGIEEVAPVVFADAERVEADGVRAFDLFDQVAEVLRRIDTVAGVVR